MAAIFAVASLQETLAFADGPKPTAAVFADPKSVSPDHAQQFADILSNQLVQKGDLSVIDRQHTETILNEQTAASSGQVTPASESQLGKMLGVNYLIVVRIESFNAESEQRNDVASFFTKQASFVTKVSLVDSLEVIDVRSGAIVETLDDQQQSTSAPSSTTMDQAFINDAATALLKTSAQSLSGKLDMSKLQGSAPVAVSSGRVLDVNGDSITLSLSSAQGIHVADFVDVFDSRSVANPDTGKTIVTLIKRGTLQITQVESDYSIAKPIGPFKPIKLEVVRTAPQ